MKNKLAKIGSKTGLQSNETANLVKIGVSGLLALVISTFIGGAGSANAADTTLHPRQGTADLSSDKCRMIPQKSASSESNVTTYYFDAETKTCKEAAGCVSSIFDSIRECNRICGGQDTSYGSKYGVMGMRDIPE